MPKLINLTGRRFGRLIILQYDKQLGKWLSQCDCGKKHFVLARGLENGHTKSCGCLQKEKAALIGVRTKTHGMSKGNIYKIWLGMKKRCYNPKCKNYSRYGGRGIKICERWQSFENFYIDMKSTYKKGLSIDRINNNGNYEPSNCRWATRSTQNTNTSKTIYLTYKGVRKPLVRWADEMGVSRSNIYRRFHNNWSMEELFLPPVKYRKGRENKPIMKKSRIMSHNIQFTT